MERHTGYPDGNKQREREGLRKRERERRIESERGGGVRGV